MYRIHWRAVKTGNTGHGTGLFTKEVASRIAKDLNSKNTGIILDASNKIKDDLLRLINNMETEKTFLLSVKG